MKFFLVALAALISVSPSKAGVFEDSYFELSQVGGDAYARIAQAQVNRAILNGEPLPDIFVAQACHLTSKTDEWSYDVDLAVASLLPIYLKIPPSNWAGIWAGLLALENDLQGENYTFQKERMGKFQKLKALYRVLDHLRVDDRAVSDLHLVWIYPDAPGQTMDSHSQKTNDRVAH